MQPGWQALPHPAPSNQEKAVKSVEHKNYAEEQDGLAMQRLPVLVDEKDAPNQIHQ
jgi:hypothetical protein